MPPLDDNFESFYNKSGLRKICFLVKKQNCPTIWHSDPKCPLTFVICCRYCLQLYGMQKPLPDRDKMNNSF